MSFQPPKGTFDVVPSAGDAWRRSDVWASTLSIWEEFVSRFGYSLVLTPIFESTELFSRSVGDETEVVTKQMYTFEDRAGRSLTLRPEGTAGIVRAFLNSGTQGAWKVSYSGPMFRYERPQRGRYRQFWQLGVEYLDVESPVADAEVIELGYRYLTEVGVPGLQVLVNSLGDESCRPIYLEDLRTYLRDRGDDLCDDSKSLVETNPLRVLDCKVCAPRLADPPAMVDALCDECESHFEAVLGLLGGLGIPFEVDKSLVRGLDYYTRTAFEFVATELEAAQNAVGGGGRYDGLAEAIGGRSAPGVGLALGLDRILLTLQPALLDLVDVYLVSEVPAAEALPVVSDLRAAGIRVDFDSSDRSVKGQFKAAGRSGAAVTIVFNGSREELDVRTEDIRTIMPFDDFASWMNGDFA